MGKVTYITNHVRLKLRMDRIYVLTVVRNLYRSYIIRHINVELKHNDLTPDHHHLHLKTKSMCVTSLEHYYYVLLYSFGQIFETYCEMSVKLYSGEIIILLQVKNRIDFSCVIKLGYQSIIILPSGISLTPCQFILYYILY